MFVCFVCCVLSGRGLCDELITRLEESYRLWCVVVCDQDTSWTRKPEIALGCSARDNNNCLLFSISLFCTMTNKCIIISQIIKLQHYSILTRHTQAACNQYLAKLHKYFKLYVWYIFNWNCVDTRWQHSSTHLHTNSTQNNTMRPNTQNGTYITKYCMIKINNITIRKNNITISTNNLHN
jgi:hypothetical protein